MSENDVAGIWDSHIHILPPYRTRGLVRWVNYPSLTEGASLL